MMKKNPHIIDLRKKNIPGRITSGKKLNDIIDIENAESREKNIILKKKPVSRGMEIVSTALVGFLLITGMNIAAAYPKNQKALATFSQSIASGYKDILAGGEKIADFKLDSAKNLFDQAQNEFEKIQNALWFLQSDEKLKKVTAVLEAGEAFSEIGKIISEPEKGLKNLTGQIKKARKALSNIDEAMIPEKYRNEFRKIKKITENAEKAGPGIEKLLNSRMLILLQNNDEVRPTGGFIGSYLLLDIENGTIKNFQIEDVYDIDDPFASYDSREIIEPPEEIKKLTDQWFFRDSNYSGDFSISGKKALWFYEKEKGASVQEPIQTIGAVTHTLLGRLLEITGPIEMAELQHPITAENYRYVFTYIIESKFEGYEDPKKILKKFGPIFQKRLMQKENFGRIQKILLEEITKKNVLGYSRDEDIQAFFEVLGMDGRMHEEQEGEDYLAIIMSNIGGNKSDANVSQTVSHKTAINPDGGILNALTIERTHRWNEEEFSKWKNALRPFGYKDFPPHIISIMGQGDNKSATRIYVPYGSILQETEGIDIEKVATKYDPDTKKTYFTFDFQLESGSEKSITFTYLLPFQFSGTYRLFVEKQPGVRPWIFHKTLDANEQLEWLKYYPAEKPEQISEKISLKKLIEKNFFFGALAKEK